MDWLVATRLSLHCTLSTQSIISYQVDIQHQKYKYVNIH